ncbi:MAG: hypothetical protein KBS95_07005 [Alistipes sp.]|nr:hypothetical protein [Candidatus Alistipes equi]
MTSVAQNIYPRQNPMRLEDVGRDVKSIEGNLPQQDVSRDIESVEPSKSEPVVAPITTATSASSKDIGDTLSENEESTYEERGYVNLKNVVVPKGQVLLGMNVLCSRHTNTNYTLFVVKDINSKGYNLKFSPVIGYAIKDNMVLGLRGGYTRTNLSINTANLEIGDDESGTKIKINDYKLLRHAYSVDFIFRPYIPLGWNRRLAFFAETQLGYTGTQAIYVNDHPIKGTYETSNSFSVSVTPGIVAFLTNRMALEINLSILGFSFNKVNQVHNQVSTGTVDTNGFHFNLDLLSIGVGMAFYL